MDLHPTNTLVVTGTTDGKLKCHHSPISELQNYAREQQHEVEIQCQFDHVQIREDLSAPI